MLYVSLYKTITKMLDIQQFHKSVAAKLLLGDYV